MGKIIVDKILELTESIKRNGKEINGTKELPSRKLIYQK